VINAHGLSPADRGAVLTWARSDAQADLYTLLVGAIRTSATSRTTDQQNAVTWLATVAQRRAVAAAQDAGLQDVQWAGPPQDGYQSLLDAAHTQSSLQSFFAAAGYPVAYNSPDHNPLGATGGYCVYRSPAPYASDYAVPSADPTCNGQPPGPFYIPNTPGY